jgi:hypothetical protein
MTGHQLYKVSTDVLSLITVAADRHPRPRLILADEEAAST